MALSGSFYNNVGSHWRIYCTWSGSQSISGNYTNITLKTYWEARTSYGAVNASATKSGSSNINGSSGSFSFSAKLSGNQRKLVNTRTVRVNHNSDGTKSGVSLSASLGVAVTLSGSYYGTVSTSTTVTLNTIPQSSSITSSASWTAGNNRSVSISRASTNFTHTVRWQVQDTGGTWRTIKTATGVKTSVNSSFTTAQNKDIFNRISQNSSRPSRIQIETYSGSTQIGGTVTKTGTCTAPNSSILTSGTDRAMYVDSSISIGISRNNSSFQHTIKLTVGSYTKTISGVGTSTSWNPSTSEENSIYGQMASVNSRSGSLELTTYYDGVQVRSSRSYTFTFRVRNSSPTFSGGFTYRDINTTTTGITGNNQYIVQGKSSLRIEIPATASASANNGATMSKYSVTVNGITKSVNYSTSAINIDFGTVNANSNSSVVVKAIDSRGNSTSSSKTVNIIPYKTPLLQPQAERLNSFEESTTITFKGSISPISIAGSSKNSISTLRYRYKKRSVSSYGSWNSLTGNTGNTVNRSVNLTLDNLVAWDIQIELTDKISTKTVNIAVPVGKPILFLDAGKNSVGINRLPSLDFSFEVDGRVYFNNPNTKSQVMPYVGSTSQEGRESLVLRGDRRGNSNGAGINLYSQDDSRFPNQIRLFGGGVTIPNMIIDNQGIKMRYVGVSGTSNFLRLTNGVEYNKIYPSSQRIGISNINTIAFLQQTAYSRTIHFGTTTGARISLEPTGSLYLPGTSGTTVRIELANQQMISTESGEFTVYGNRGKGRSFKVRSHVNKSSYRNDFWIREDGNFASAHLYNSTSSNSQNARVSYTGSTSEGMIFRVVSAKKYKTDIEPIYDVNPYNLLKLEPKSWYDKNEVINNGGYTKGLTRSYGLIADELEDVGLHQYVDYMNGEIEGLQYERLWTLLIPIVKEHHSEIEDLKNIINSLIEYIGREQG